MGAFQTGDGIMKRLVVCFDGTWNAADSEKAETNVARIYRAIREKSGSDGVHQLAFYERGVGTSGLKSFNLLAGATGLGLGDNIRSAYVNLAKNYEQGDEIFLFGFSRGAFSARSLSGLISACGLLKRESLDKINQAWSYYRDEKLRSPQAFSAATGAKVHTDVSIRFLGVWDTVGALGVPVGVISQALSGEVFEFHDTSPSRIVKHAVQALAIDESRDAFVPTFWTGEAPAGVTIEQVWFAGAHSDVGGGYELRRAADIPLRFMAKRAEFAGLKLDWTSGALPPETAALDALTDIHESRDGIAVFDRLTPTIRRVLEQNIDVAPQEKLYMPLGPKRKPLKTINERLHESVVQRYGQAAALLSESDKVGKSKRSTYAPRNLKPLFGTDGRLKKDFKPVS
jgi:Uncharacterized alpha/beta hydrolase domain (DUF2235)